MSESILEENEARGSSIKEAQRQSRMKTASFELMPRMESKLDSSVASLDKTQTRASLNFASALGQDAFEDTSKFYEQMCFRLENFQLKEKESNCAALALKENRLGDTSDREFQADFSLLYSHFANIMASGEETTRHLKEIEATSAKLMSKVATPAALEKLLLVDHNLKIIMPREKSSDPVDSRGSMLRSGDMNNKRQSFLPAAVVAAPKAFGKLPKEILDANLTKPELMRFSTIYELIETEADYIRDLMTMIQFHKLQLKESKILGDAEVNTIFSNVDQLVIASQGMHTRMQARKDLNIFISEIGDVISDSSEALKVYTVYAANYPAAMKLVQQIQAKPEGKELLQRLMNSTEARGLSLESFLIKPVQRICKYPLLIRELEKHTEKSGNTTDMAFLRIAAEKIEAVVLLVNEATRAAEEKQRILNLEFLIESEFVC